MKVLGVAKRTNGSVVRVQDGDDPAPIIEAWTPGDLEAVQAWNGTVPPTFKLRDGKNGKILVEDKPRGGGSYSQSKEAFDRSAESRLAWQREEEDRKDRRTALMTAVEGKHYPPAHEQNIDLWLEDASRMYAWLKNPDAVHGKGAASDRSGEEGKAAPAAADSSRDKHGSSPEHHFPADPLTCGHRYGTGAPAKVKVGKQEICRLCGTPWVSAMESTTQDLGPA